MKRSFFSALFYSREKKNSFKREAPCPARVRHLSCTSHAHLQFSRSRLSHEELVNIHWLMATFPAVICQPGGEGEERGLAEEAL